MSNTYSRRGVNVSHYLQDLNTIEDQTTTDPYNPAADDLSIWTDTTFFDFDMGGQVVHDPIAPSTRQELKPQPSATTASTTAIIDSNLKDGAEFDHFLHGVDFKEFGSGFEYNPQFARFNDPTEVRAAAAAITSTTAGNSPEQTMSRSTSAAPNPSGFRSSSARIPASPTDTESSPAALVPRGSKRKASTAPEEESPGGNLEEASRFAAEEDKRRRNTAASARFRVKKKQKEQQLEKTAKEMTQRVGQLEERIQVLEMENKWLKNLIVEKNGGKSGEEIMAPPTIASGNKDGVGTVKAEN
ncbi:hypothetical protein EDC01DRAFT_648543 [Geopyxis carbonaria]|nr:hypothetical protein EDC01DRAFT_648543 [Geopyxis carbonaria]